MMRAKPPPASTTAATAATAAAAVTAAPTPAPAPDTGATTPAGIEALADSLSSSADALHEAIMRALRRRERDPDHGVTQDAVQALFEQEVALRQSANRLYLDAAALAIAGLGGVEQALMDVTAAARDQLQRAARLQDLVALAAGLAALGGAIAAGKPSQLPAALKNVRDSIAALHGARQA